MKKRIIYPGAVGVGDRIVITGAINTMFLSDAATALKQGIQSKGYSCRVLAPGMVRPSSDHDQAGDVASFSYSADVSLLNMGEYLGGARFRQGGLPQTEITRAVFFSDIANPSISFMDRPKWERERILETEAYLSAQIGVPTTLAATRLIRPSGTELRLLETTNELLFYLERGLTPPTALTAERDTLYASDGMDQIPALERRLW